LFYSTSRTFLWELRLLALFILEPFWFEQIAKMARITVFSSGLPAYSSLSGSV
jgi:hypothetical protein